MPPPAAGALLALVGVSALVLALIALAGPIARRYGRARLPAVLIALVLALPLAPIRATLGLGSLDLLLFGLVTADVVALRRSAWARSRAAWWPGPPASRPPSLLLGRFSSLLLGRFSSLLLLCRFSSLPGGCVSWLGRGGVSWLRRGWATGAWAGVGTGIATALAIGPGLFIAYLAVTRQWRAAVTATITAATLLAAGSLAAPGATWLPRPNRLLDDPLNQSLAGVLARLYDSTTTPILIWLSFSALLVAVGLTRARSAHTDGDEIAAFTLVGLTGAAVGPVTRIHELVWIVPAILILVDAAAHRRVTTKGPKARRHPGLGFAIAAALVYSLTLADPRWTAGWNGYAFTLILLLNALPWRPGVAPAIPARRQPQPLRRAPAIPGPRAR